MSDKTFLQELQSIKRNLEFIESYHDDTNSVVDDFDEDEVLRVTIEIVKRMIDQCLEIQLAMMKQGTMPDVKGR